MRYQLKVVDRDSGWRQLLPRSIYAKPEAVEARCRAFEQRLKLQTTRVVVEAVPWPTKRPRKAAE